ncbi:helix-turn-helix domain-containing protein [Sphingomonas sp. Tas61C01]|uniref:helix-turn-helix domain-containing protein n=1 Tax=Sphingomonas sp. Tas61C01 TaxID=3458297 RepID=UPI00403EE017
MTLGAAQTEGSADDGIVVDPYRSVVFPNRVREQRIRRGHPRLFAFAATIPQIPYIRLSKIERGEVFARADELLRIARALEIAPTELLLDVDSPSFDIATWFIPFADGTASDSLEEAEFAMLLAAAVRARRDADSRLTAATMDRDFGIPPVILSRVENAQKGLSRWNDQTVGNLCRLFDVADEAALREHILGFYRDGGLNRFLASITGAEQRRARTRQRVAALAIELRQAGDDRQTHPEVEPSRHGARRTVPVFGAPLTDGLIAMTPTGLRIDAPAIAGARAFGMRVGRPTLGGGLPGQATVIVDPDRFPQAGGLVLVREGDAYRILAVAVGRDGRMLGYSTAPEHELALDTLETADVAAIVAAQMV